MIMSNTMYNLNRNLSNMNKRYTQLSTGKRVNKPSDDPVSASKALKLRADVSEIEQHQRNNKDALSWLDITESAVDNLQEVFHRAKELTVQAATGTMGKNDREKVVYEIKQLKEQIMQIGNTTYAGRYIFSGFQTDKKLFSDTTGDGTYNIDVTGNQNIKYQIGVGEQVEVGVFGTELFGKDGSGTKSKVVEDFDELITRLEAEPRGDIKDSLAKIEKNLDNTLKVRAEIGAKTNRLELVEKRLEKDKINFTELLSENEDVDMAETIMHLKMEESVYRASLSAGAQVIQPTLLDFIR
jgi:flagellar hook-associated protein 3 FlgL